MSDFKHWKHFARPWWPTDMLPMVYNPVWKRYDRTALAKQIFAFQYGYTIMPDGKSEHSIIIKPPDGYQFQSSRTLFGQMHFSGNYVKWPVGLIRRTLWLRKE